MVFLDALTLNKPEIFIGNCMERIDAKTGQITDAATRDVVKLQLAAFAAFIMAHGGKGQRADDYAIAQPAEARSLVPVACGA